MIKNFFQNLEHERVSYLLISGQAAVLYGAAAFSEDIDLWVHPSQENIGALLKALSKTGAVYYKLTPPVEPEYMLRGHGFHFRLPEEPDFYLDVMGRPPRVPDFDVCLADSVMMKTGWGLIPTIGLRHLVALKATQRIEDYPVISRLVLRYMEKLSSPTEDDYQWAIHNIYTVDELGALLGLFPQAKAVCTGDEVLMRFADETLLNGETGEDIRSAAETLLFDRARLMMRTDRAYWSSIIQELRDLRTRGILMPVGQPVSAPPRP